MSYMDREAADITRMPRGGLLPLVAVLPFAHDGLISWLRAYSPSALRSLARHTDPAIEVELHGRGLGLSLRARPQIVVAYRPR